MLQSFIARLVEKKECAPGVFWFNFHLQSPATIDFSAGQYVIVKIPQQDGVSLTRLYSICSPDFEKNHIELLVHMVPHGRASLYFTNLSIGEVISLQAPAGVFTLRGNERNKVFLATGTGIAPIRSQITTFLKNQSAAGVFPQLSLWWGVRTAHDAYFFKEFAAFAKTYPNFKFAICLSRETSLHELDPARFHLGRITNHLDGVGLSRDADYYLCGDPDIVLSLTLFLEKRGIAKESIFCEKF